MLPAIAAVLEVKESADEPLVDSVALSLLGGQALVVLDNFEQLLAAARVVAESARTAPRRLQFLVTSRAPLQLRGEHEYAVPPLALPRGTVRVHRGALAHRRRWRCSSSADGRGPARLHAGRRQRRGRGRDLHPPGRAAAGDRAGRGPRPADGADRRLLARLDRRCRC